MKNYNQFSIEENPASWDYIKWLKAFRDSRDKHNLRTEVFLHTISVVKNNGFYINQDEKIILHNTDSIQEKTVYYTNPDKVYNSTRPGKTEILVMNADCLEVSRMMSASGLNPAVLNMANRHTPGGGVFHGAGAQEENIFRRSNFYLSLYQFADIADKYEIKRNKHYSYPLDRNTGGIYSPEVTIFRGLENQGYCLLKKPYKVSFITVPAINRPSLELDEEKYRITKNMIEPTKRKIRTILRIAALHNHDSLVLSAFGCGAFCNPPNHVAELFHKVFQEDEFLNLFRTIVFAIISDHNSGKKHNPEGNLLPFLKEFS